jgi:hypothetical protein
MSEKGLLVIACRVDNADEIRKRVETVLAVAATYDRPPDTTPVAWAKPLSELVASDLDLLAALVGWRAVEDLNAGFVVSEELVPENDGKAA